MYRVDPSKMRPCAADGCDELVRRAEYCKIHHDRLRQTGRLQTYGVRKPCQAEGCVTQAGAKAEYCNLHQSRLRIHGRLGKVRPSPGTPLADRIDFYTERVGSCLEWTGYLNQYGYGVIGIGKALHLAHRVSYELAAGPIPTGLALDHLCRNTKCVEPTHLEPVTWAENARRQALVTP